MGTWTYANHLYDGMMGSGTLVNIQAINVAINDRTMSERQRLLTSNLLSGRFHCRRIVPSTSSLISS